MKRIATVIFAIFFIFICNPSLSQVRNNLNNKTLDSLQHIIDSEKDKSKKQNIILDFLSDSFRSKPKLVIDYVEDLFKKNQY